MKLMNFRSFDLAYAGKGLAAAGSNDRVGWNELSGDARALRALAEATRTAYASAKISRADDDPFDGVEEAV